MFMHRRDTDWTLRLRNGMFAKEGWLSVDCHVAALSGLHKAFECARCVRRLVDGTQIITNELLHATCAHP